MSLLENAGKSFDPLCANSLELWFFLPGSWKQSWRWVSGGPRVKVWALKVEAWQGRDENGVATLRFFSQSLASWELWGAPKSTPFWTRFQNLKRWSLQTSSESFLLWRRLLRCLEYLVVDKLIYPETQRNYARLGQAQHLCATYLLIGADTSIFLSWFVLSCSFCCSLS